MTEPIDINFDANDESAMYERAAYFFAHDYHDRGMVKWQGYFLSDHTEDVKKRAAEEKAVMQRQRMPEMTLNDITNILMHAYANTLSVRVQTNSKSSSGVVPPIIEGSVKGYTENGVIIGESEIPLDNLWWAAIN